MRELLEKRFPDLVALMVALGFMTLLAELLLTGHTEGLQVLAPVAAGVGAGLTALGLLVPRLHLPSLAALLLVGASGLVGLVVHLEESLEGAGKGWVQTVDEEGYAYLEYPQEAEGGQAGEEPEGNPPPLAPLSLSGLGLLGALALYVKRP